MKLSVEPRPLDVAALVSWLCKAISCLIKSMPALPAEPVLDFAPDPLLSDPLDGAALVVEAELPSA